jgi:hypothetical protein
MVLYSRYKTWSFGPGYLLEGKDLPRILRPCQGQSKIILIDVGQGVWVFVDHADGVCRTGGYTQSATDTFLQGNDGDVVSHVDAYCPRLCSSVCIGGNRSWESHLTI